jgi:hypothetical protein
MDDGISHGQMAERSLAQKTRCPCKEKRYGGFKCFQGSLNRESKTVASNLLHIDLVIIPGCMTSVTGSYVVVNKPFRD